MKIMALTLMALCCLCLNTMADTYSWRVTQPGTFAWEVTNGWDVIGDLANSNLWPRNPGDVANLFAPITQTQSYGNFQVWFTESKYIGDLAVSFSNATGGGILFTAANSPLVVFLNPEKGYSSIIHTNVTPLTSDGAPNNQVVIFFDNTVFILSNDLHIANVCVENPSNLTDYTDLYFAEDTQIRGNGHKVIMTGPGWLHFDDNGKLLGASELQINGSVLEVINAYWGTTEIDCPIYLNSLYNCRNEYQRSFVSLVGKIFNMSFVGRQGSYFSTPYSGDGTTSWLQRELAGTLRVDGSIFMWPYWVDDGRIWTNDLTGTVSGEGTFYTGFSDVRSGAVRFLGRIQPGVTGAGALFVRTFTNYFVSFGTKDDLLDVEIDVDGMRDWLGEDADFLGYVQGSMVAPANLGNINLTINVGAASNPYRTNEIMWSREQQLAGDFSSVTWLGGRTGEVIVTPESVFVTGIPPATSNFFDVLPDQIVLLQGQTQDAVTIRSPFNVAVNVSNDAPWITTAAQVPVVADTPVQSVVTVPADQPVTNGWGMSRGDLWYTAANEPAVSYNVPVFVVQPGYFELNTRQLYFLADAADYLSVSVYAPFSANISAAAINAPWITLSPASVSVEDSEAYIDINVTAQPAGTTGTVRFTNSDVPSVQHDVEVYVVANGFFDTVEKELVFVQGETQKWFEIFSPFRAEVDMAATNAPWIDVPPHVSMDADISLVPVTIAANQPVDSSGVIELQNSCFPDITNTVAVTVVPEAGAFSLAAVVLMALWRRR